MIKNLTIAALTIALAATTSVSIMSISLMGEQALRVDKAEETLTESLIIHVENKTALLSSMKTVEDLLAVIEIYKANR